MRKLIFLFVCVSLALPCGAKADVNLVNLVKKIQPAVVTVITYDRDKKLSGQGSGFFIDKEGHLITNYHVLRGAYSAEVKTFDGKKYPVKLVLAESEEADLIKVAVDIPEKAVNFVQVVKDIPEVAERVVVVGSPMGLEQTVSEGIVSAVREIPTIGKMFQVSAPISPGSSGSPVVNMKAQVIGVATFWFRAGQNLNFAVSGEQVLALKSAKEGKMPMERTSGVSKMKMGAAENLYQRGLKFLRADEYEKALDCFKKATEVNKRLGEAWFSVGYCYDKLGRYQEAIESFKQAIRIKPDYAAAHYNVGGTYLQLDHYQEALEACKQAIRIKPDYAKAHYSLGMVYLILGDKGSALEQYKILMTLDKYRANKLFNLIYE